MAGIEFADLQIIMKRWMTENDSDSDGTSGGGGGGGSEAIYAAVVSPSDNQEK